MHNGAIISLDRVSFAVGAKPIIRDITLDIQRGERVALLGANGAGKSTLLRLLNGLIEPSVGTIECVERGQQAMIFQKPVLLKRTATENVSYPLIARGVGHAEALEKSRAALAACGLEALANRYARTLSGGEQQCLALARASVTVPALLLADEPTASLAPAAVHRVENILLSLAEQGTTLVFATHNRGQAKRLATRIVFLEDGSIAEDASAATFFQSPQSQAAIDYLNVERA